jgi:Flp pilus assembly protein TadD
MAIDMLETMLKTNPRNTEALVRLGKAQLMQGNTTAAEATYRRAVLSNPAHAEARIGLAKLLLDRNAAEAEPLFAAAAAAEPGNASAFNNLGIARDIQGKHATAQEAYRQALALNPDLHSAQQNLGLSLAFSGRTAEGVAILTQITNAGLGGRRARDNLAVALVLAGDTAEAGRLLREELSPADAQKAIEGYRALRAPPTISQ